MKIQKILLILFVASISTVAFANETVTDACGNSYDVVVIGDQHWMGENIKCEKYDTESEAYKAGVTQVPAFTSSVYTPYYYDGRNDVSSYSSKLTPELRAKLGYLYNWAAAVGVEDGKSQTSAFPGDRQGICPNGWHVPTQAEFEVLVDFIENTDGKGASTAGKHLKYTSGWFGSSVSGLDTYGFGALPAGSLYNGNDSNIGYNIYLWSASHYDDGNMYAHYRYINGTYDDFYFFNYGTKDTAYSVRCVENSDPSSVAETSESATTAVYKEVIDGQVVIVSGDRKFNLSGKALK